MADENNHGNRGFFAHELRIALWLKHLNGPGYTAFKKSHVADFLNAAVYWRHPLPNSLIERYDVDGDKKLQKPNLEAKDDPSLKPYTPAWKKAWDKSHQDGS